MNTKASVGEISAEPAEQTKLVPLRFPTMLRKMWSGGDVQDWLDRHGPVYVLHVSKEAEQAKAEPAEQRLAELEAEREHLLRALKQKDAELAEKEAALKEHYRAREGIRSEVANYRWLRSNATLHRSAIPGFVDIRVSASVNAPAGLDDLLDQIRTQHQSPA